MKTKNSKYTNKYFIILALTLSFFIINSAQANSKIILNEIAWMGTTNSSNDEWIELKNQNEEVINLNGWKLISEDGSINIDLTGEIPSGGFFLLERTDDNSVEDINANQIYTGTLGNDGEILSLYDAENNLVDLIDASSGWPGGDNNTKQTLERADQLDWQTSLAPLGTPKKTNSQNKIETSETEYSNSATERPCYLGEILISEFIADPSENNNEWIELYNTTYRDISVENWTLEDGNGAITKLSGIIYKNSFLTIDNPKGKLNNDGDFILLRDQNQVLIDQVSYGNWDDGNTKDNAPTTNDPNSIARQKENYNTKNDSLDFFITTTPTKNESNIITAPENNEEKSENTMSLEIYITEILPNPISTDYENEFIEIYNNSDTEINLENWSLKTSVNEYKLNYNLKAKKFLILYRKDSGLILKNDEETVSFLNNKNKLIQKVNFKNAPEGQSYNLSSENIWSWEKTISPGKDNIIKIINQAPNVEFYFLDEAQIGQGVFFDSSDTYDPDSKELSFFWDFGDGFTNSLPNPEHIFLKAGKFLINLKVSDGENTTQKEKNIKIISKSNQAYTPVSQTDTEDIIINEIFPNPADDENNEWIEIYNQGNTKINLHKWQLDDDENGSSPYLFPDFDLDANTYKVIKRSDSKIILNNDADTVRLFDSENNLLDKVKYENSLEGQSYARGLNGKWSWSETPTPNEANEIDIKVAGIYQDFASNFSTQTETESSVETPLSEIKNKNIGDQITTQGIVTVLPGNLGSQFFYINDDNAGLQIYSYKKDFCEINLGDLIEVSGELSQINNEWRLKIKTADDIKILENNQTLETEYFACGEITEDLLGRLLPTSGEIAEKKGSTLYIDDGTGELAVYLKTGTNIDIKNYQENDYIEITGILSQTSSGIKLMPRSSDDILVKRNDNSEISAEKPQETLNIPARDQNKLLKYLTIVFFTIFIVILVIFYREKH